MWASLSTATMVLLALLEAVAIVRAVTRGRGVELTLAWIFAILALPGVGAVAYLLLANPRIHGPARRRRLSRRALRRGLARDLGPREDRRQQSSSPLLHLAATATDLAPTAGNTVTLLTHDERTFEQMEAALAAATQSIWAEYYIIRNDQTGQRFLELLTERAAAGVEVRLLYDAVGSLRLDAGRLARLEQAGGKIAPFLSVNPLRRRWALHLRNHRKLVVVDGELGFTGGMNIGDEYSGRARRRRVAYFRDAHLMIRGPAVADLAQIFVEDWCFTTDRAMDMAARPAPVGDTVVAVVPSGPDQEYNASSLTFFTAVSTARERVLLTSPYFVPDEPLTRALVSAAMRGVDVRVLVPERTDLPFVRAAARSYYPRLVRSGVKISEYQPSMLHAKTLVVDERCSIVGSANADVRSFRLNFELGVLVVDRSFAQQLAGRFELDSVTATAIDADWLAARRWYARLLSGVARLLSPLL